MLQFDFNSPLFFHCFLFITYCAGLIKEILFPVYVPNNTLVDTASMLDYFNPLRLIVFELVRDALLHRLDLSC